MGRREVSSRRFLHRRLSEYQSNKFCPSPPIDNLLIKYEARLKIMLLLCHFVTLTDRRKRLRGHLVTYIGRFGILNLWHAVINYFS